MFCIKTTRYTYNLILIILYMFKSGQIWLVKFKKKTHTTKRKRASKRTLRKRGGL